MIYLLLNTDGEFYNNMYSCIYCIPMFEVCFRGGYHEIFHLHFISSSCSTWDPDSWVEQILLISLFFSRSCLSFFPGVRYNIRGFPFMWDTVEEIFPVWDTTEEVFLQCGIYHRKISGHLKKFSVVSQKEVFFPLYPRRNGFSFVVAHTTKESSPVYTTTHKVLFYCRIQWRNMVQREIILFNFMCLSLASDVNLD